jgi:deoxyribodipyrimidine photolyase
MVSMVLQDAVQMIGLRYSVVNGTKTDHAKRPLAPAGRKGKTGYPIGCRQRTGWMHNRVRMVVASFLVKHLLIDGRLGEQWFRDTLIDTNLANNPCLKS